MCNTSLLCCFTAVIDSPPLCSRFSLHTVLNVWLLLLCLRAFVSPPVSPIQPSVLLTR